MEIRALNSHFGVEIIGIDLREAAENPNTSESRRVGVAIRYITPATRQTRVDEDYATLVCGEDRFGHFRAEIVPETTMSPEAVTFHQRVAESQGKIYLSKTNRAGIKGLVETNADAG